MSRKSRTIFSFFFFFTSAYLSTIVLPITIYSTISFKNHSRNRSDHESNCNPTAYRSIILRLVQFNAQKERRRLCSSSSSLSPPLPPLYKNVILLEVSYLQFTLLPLPSRKIKESKEKRETTKRKIKKERGGERNKRKKKLRERCAFNVKDKPAGISSKGSMARTG